jgi:hypothetical protein
VADELADELLDLKSEHTSQTEELETLQQQHKDDQNNKSLSSLWMAEKMILEVNNYFPKNYFPLGRPKQQVPLLSLDG